MPSVYYVKSLQLVERWICWLDNSHNPPKGSAWAKQTQTHPTKPRIRKKRQQKPKMLYEETQKLKATKENHRIRETKTMTPWLSKQSVGCTVIPTRSCLCLWAMRVGWWRTQRSLPLSSMRTWFVVVGTRMSCVTLGEAILGRNGPPNMIQYTSVIFRMYHWAIWGVHAAQCRFRQPRAMSKQREVELGCCQQQRGHHSAPFFGLNSGTGVVLPETSDILRAILDGGMLQIFASFYLFCFIIYTYNDIFINYKCVYTSIRRSWKVYFSDENLRLRPLVSTSKSHAGRLGRCMSSC